MTARRLLQSLAIALLVPAMVAAANRPPKNLHLVGDHWTAWDPPTSFPEGSEVYTIRRGDTLWDLAARFYGNPYLWPQIWERNRYIADAHWIYPGDPLLMGMEATPIEDLEDLGGAEVGETGAPGDEEAAGLRLGRFSGPPVPLGSEDDIACSGYIGPVEESFEFSIVGSEYENLAPTLAPGSGANITGRYGKVDTVKLDLSLGDIVYLDGGSEAGLTPGSVFTIVAAGDKLNHPLTGELLGRLYDYQGRVRVLSVQPRTGIAEVVHACEPIRVGALLRLYEPEPVPLGRRSPIRGFNDPVSYEALQGAPVIVRSDVGLVSLGQDHVVFIDRGAAHDVTPGDVFTIYRLNSPGLPPVVVGELAVLSVEEQTALAKILESRYSIYVGDRLDLKAP